MGNTLKLYHVTCYLLCTSKNTTYLYSCGKGLRKKIDM